MSSMHAVVIADDAQRSLRWEQVERPTYGPDQLLIRVVASAVNRADLLQRRGLYPVPPGASQILGLEASGVIEAVGDDVSGWKVGDEVCALLEGGGYAEYVVIDASMALPLPPGLTALEAAAVPEVFYTAWLNLFVEGALMPGQRAFIHAAASGVGTAGLQLCRAFGNPVFASASRGKLDACTEYGATWLVDRTTQPFKDVVRQTLSHLPRHEQGVDVVFDMVGGGVLNDNIDILNVDGRLVVIGLLGGAKDELNLGKLLMKRIRVIGSTLRSRSREDKVVLTEQLRDQVWPKFASGELKPVIDRILPISEVEEAHRALETNATIGKVLLQMP